MDHNPRLALLQPYPFERLRTLNEGVLPNPSLSPIQMSIGEPRHEAPALVLRGLSEALAGLSLYPVTKGIDALREGIANWLTWRFQLSQTPDPARHILPVNGSREALFSFVQAMLGARSDALVLMPNPFYQIYEGAALLAGATPYFLPSLAENAFLPDYDAVPESLWKKTSLVFLCNPANPSGAVTPIESLMHLIELADRHDFMICADECYSEIYPQEDAPPPGLLQAAAQMGRDDFDKLMVFHSLSKRSNLPGLRSGFVAGDARLIEKFLLYRTYHGSAMSLPTQVASLIAWGDEEHVRLNRSAYRAKFAGVTRLLSAHTRIQAPDASFYLWLATSIDDTIFARELWRQQHVQVLPGSFLGRQVDDHNPGAGFVRIALVPELETCLQAAQRLQDFLKSLKEPQA